MEIDALVREYLARLEAAAAGLPAERRTELVGEVREHIETAIAEEPTRSEASVRNVLDRLGSPEEIVAAEAAPSDPTVEPAVIAADGAAAATRPGIGLLEVVALLLLTFGMFMAPIVGPAVGLALVWFSRALSTRQKVAVTAIVVVLVLLPVLALLSVGGASGGIEGSAIPAR